MDPIENLVVTYWPLIMAFFLKLITGLAIFMIGKYISTHLRTLISKALQLRNVDTTIEHFIANVTYYLMLILVIVVVLSQLGVETASLVAVLGAMGLAVGLALQGSLSNFASGVLLILLRPCKIGDYVEAGGVAGTVTNIDILATTMTTPDNKVILIPNSSIMSQAIVNYSTMPTRRVDLMVGVAYDTDLAKAKSILLELVASDSRILSEPAVPLVGVKALADSSINFLVRFWVGKDDYWPVQYDLQQLIVETFAKNDITIPFPQMDVHLSKEG
jgi:small conductance mechanosensitive channel